jgi:hypothetical protein
VRRGKAEAHIPQQSQPLSVEGAVAIVVRARHHAAFPKLNDQDVAKLAREIEALVKIAHAGHGTPVPAKWERERAARKLMQQLRKGRVDGLQAKDGTLTDFDLALLDLDLLNPARQRRWAVDPDEGAREIEAAMRRARRLGYYGRPEPIGRRRDAGRLPLIVSAIEIFTKHAGLDVTTSPQSFGAAFISAILQLSGTATTGLAKAIAEAITLMTLTDHELDRRRDR